MGTLFEMIERRMLFPEISLSLPDEKKLIRTNFALEFVENVLIGQPDHRPSIQTCQAHPWIQSYLSSGGSTSGGGGSGGGLPLSS
jgi:hypothetical protein